MQKEIKNALFKGANNKTSLYDLVIPNQWNGKLIVFIHGYMGYKDWGAWNLVSDYFTNESFGFLKYNVSHNGGTIENPIDFDDLEAFAENNYSKEVQDFEAIIDLISKELEKKPEIFVIGHSRGGGIALLQSRNNAVNKIATWAAISRIDTRFPADEKLEHWKKNGVYYRKNGRTNQEMPHNYSQYENFIQNKDRLDIQSHCLNSKTPTLVIHGDKDTSVTINEGKEIAQWLKTNLEIIEEAQHTFESKQPWNLDDLPLKLEIVCQKTLDFFNQ